MDDQYEEIDPAVSDRALKKQLWDAAIGLQDVDGLKPSAYMLELVEQSIDSTIQDEQIERKLYAYYEEKDLNQPLVRDEQEADIVASRIYILLSQGGYDLSIPSLKGIHDFLFEGIYDHAGQFRTKLITKQEAILYDAASVEYAHPSMFERSLEYLIDFERNTPYELPFDHRGIERIAEFTSDIWWIHPFREGNTRTTAVFIELYLRRLGFAVDNEPFSNNSWYFRNALVRANYENIPLGVNKTRAYLEQFFENLLGSGNNELKNRKLYVEELKPPAETK
jgi:fido (protein-threonine AMPylation protein)